MNATVQKYGVMIDYAKEELQQVDKMLNQKYIWIPVKKWES